MRRTFLIFAAACLAALGQGSGPDTLLWAVHDGNVADVERLLKSGANANSKNEYGLSPLAEAANVGNTAIIKALLDAGAEPNALHFDGQTALMVIARSTNVEAAKLLLAKGANPNLAESQKNQTALLWAAASSNGPMVKILLDAGANPNARTVVNENSAQVSAEPRAQYRSYGGLTPLLYATREGCLDCVAYLVERGAKINMTDPEGVTPLITAILNMHFDVAKLLIEAGANPDKWDWWNRTPLYLAADVNTIPRGGRADAPSLDETTSLEIIDLLLKRGANPNVQVSLLVPFRQVGADRGVDLLLTTGVTPLLRAAKALDAPAVKLMMDHGGDPNLPQVKGITPLMAAAGMGSVDADTRGRYDTPDTAQRSVDTLRILLDKGGDIMARDSRGQTALHAAAFWGWNDAVQFLVSRGADVNAKDSKGLVPIDNAMGRNGGNSRGGARVDVHQDTADLLVRLGATLVVPPAAKPAPAKPAR
ncbi:MAG: ankyrin repeat domain-containing protein [Bryobacteraceae bacterium]